MRHIHLLQANAVKVEDSWALFTSRANVLLSTELVMASY